MIQYKIFQVKDDKTRNFGFMGLWLMKRIGVEISLENYDMVYEGESETDIPRLLDELFFKFNEELPEDYKARSMSVSDLVMVHDSYYFCDSFGWERIEVDMRNISSI